MPTEIDADDGAELIRELIAQDENAARLGEVALVDSASRVGESGLVFHDTLLDENASQPHRARLRLLAPVPTTSAPPSG